MVETTISIVQVLPDTKIAQLILLPYKKDKKKLLQHSPEKLKDLVPLTMCIGLRLSHEDTLVYFLS